VGALCKIMVPGLTAALDNDTSGFVRVTQAARGMQRKRPRSVVFWPE
jgi:hypothetical protein